MAYVCQLGAGQSVYLENQAAQTVVTLISSGPGQQQQASSSFATGVWTSPPQVFQTPHGMVLKVTSEQGERMLQIQGSSVSLMGEIPLAADSEQLTVQEVTSLPVSPRMEPMKPMNLKMGDMEMNMNPMSMRMGNMELGTGSPAASAKSFCSQCGTSVKPEDRFCSNCGHQL